MIEDDIAHIKQALLNRQNDVFRNACEQLDGIADLLRDYQRYMGKSGRAVMGEQYQQRQPESYDPYGVPTQRRN
jgi:hypothetical protein